MAGYNFIGIGGTGNFDTNEIATMDPFSAEELIRRMNYTDIVLPEDIRKESLYDSKDMQESKKVCT